MQSSSNDDRLYGHDEEPTPTDVRCPSYSFRIRKKRGFTSNAGNVSRHAYRSGAHLVNLDEPESGGAADYRSEEVDPLLRLELSPPASGVQHGMGSPLNPENRLRLKSRLGVK